MANPFDQFDEIAQAQPRLRPDPIERPGGEQQRGAPRAQPRRGNPFDQFDAQPTPQPQAPTPEAPAQEPSASADPSRFQFMPPDAQGMKIDPALQDAARQALERAPPELRQKIMDEWKAGHAKPDSQGMDIVKSLGTGLVKGATGLATLPGTVAQAWEAGWDKIGSMAGIDMDEVRKHVKTGRQAAPHTALPGYREAIQGVEAVGGPLRTPQTTGGQYAQTVGEFTAGGATSGSLPRRVANVLAPAIVSETGGQIAKGSDYEGAARLAGAVAGARLPDAAMRAVTPFPSVYPERARMARVMEREGVPLTAGDKTGSKRLRYAESTAEHTPLTGHRIQTQSEHKFEKFTQAAMARAGIRNAERATDTVIDARFKDLGREFEQYALRVAIPVTPRLNQSVDAIVRRYEQSTAPTFVNPLPRTLAKELAQAGQLTGRQYGKWRSDLGEVARAEQNPGTQRTLYELQKTLDQAADRMLRQTGRRDLANRMVRTRAEYRNLLVLSRARGNTEDAVLGIITPQRLGIAARQMEGVEGFSRGRGELTALAKAGSATMVQMPNSGTAQRALSHGLFALPGALLGLGTVGGAEGVGLGAVGGAMLQGLTARGLMSKPVQKYLGNQTLTKALQNRKARTSVPLSAVLARPQDERK